MKLVKKLLSFIFLIFLINACATFKAQYANEEKSFIKKDSTNIAHTFYLIGDAGNSPLGKKHPTLVFLEKETKKASKNATLIFLGDNVYEAGVAEENTKAYKTDKHKITAQTDVGNNFAGRTIFIPGNHDWYNGLKGLKRQEKLVENALGKNSFLPENGCPIEKVEISDDIVLIIVDTHWYLTNWDEHPTINDECDIKTRQEFFEKFESYIKKSRGKTTVVAMHHPMFTNGPHGGYYSLKSHMKPLPIIGTIQNILRITSGISNTDLHHKKYNELKKRIVTLSQENDKTIFVSGHEHSLQYFVQDNIPQIISGSGSKESATKLKTAEFTYGSNGFVKLEVYKDGSSHAQYFSLKDDKIVFETDVLPPSQRKDFKTYPKFKDSIKKASVYTKEEVTKSDFYNFLWGERYRKYFGTKISAPTVNLDTLFGGLVPVRKGGGHQSKSLRLRDKKGREYVMRALRKNALQYLQSVAFKNQYIEGQFKGTLTESLLLDVFTGSHPYAPFVVGKLADAVNVYHTNPVLYYVPKQNSLGYYNSEFGDELYMIEEHAGDGHGDKASFGFSNEVMSTNDLLEKINKSEGHEVDEASYIRARLFDMLIGDFDRHEDQWRWLVFEENGKTIYKALPRDRDQVFSIFGDGAILGYFTGSIPALRSMVSYSENLKSPKWFNSSSYALDMALINESDKNVWDAQVKLITTNLTDEIIDEAFKNFPTEVQDETIVEIKKKLIGRRKNLQKIADKYFSHINDFQVIKGTNKDDWFDIERQENGKTKVSIYRIIGGEKKRLFHQRTYNYDMTKEIWIYGLDDDDQFVVKGDGEKLIKIRLIGGQNNDVYDIKNGKKIIIYDYKSKKNTFITNKGKIKLTDDYQTNVYDYQKLKNSSYNWSPKFGFNPDDGLRIGVSNVFINNGFERNPFTSQHIIDGSYFLATSGFEFNYKGEIARIIKNWNLGINATYTTPNYSTNFFGFGNNSSNPEAYDLEEENYNRVKIRKFIVGSSLNWKGFLGTKVKAAINYQSFKIQRTEGRFIETQFSEDDPIFQDQKFINSTVSFNYENADNNAFPTMGMKLNAEAGYTNNLGNSNNFGYLISSLSIDYRLIPSGRVVLASKVKSHITVGDDFEFYQGASIGGDDGLRGYRNQRFIGKSSIYHSSDIRFNLRRIKTELLPLSIGLYVGFDYGKVYYDNFIIQPTFITKSINTSYGGGAFFNAADMITGNVSAFNSDDGIRIAFTLGFGF